MEKLLQQNLVILVMGCRTELAFSTSEWTWYQCRTDSVSNDLLIDHTVNGNEIQQDNVDLDNFGQTAADANTQVIEFFETISIKPKIQIEIMTFFRDNHGIIW